MLDSTSTRLIALTRAEEQACGSPSDATDTCLATFRLTNSEFLASLVDLALRPARIVLIFVLAWILVRVFRRSLNRSIRQLEGGNLHRHIGRLRGKAPRILVGEDADTPNARRAQRLETIGRLANSTGTVAIWTLAFAMMLAELGVKLGPLIAGAGIVGVALGFGAQNLVRDFLSGIFMLAEDQYGLGDVIDVGEASGQVEGIGLRTTRLRDAEGVVWHIPNGEIKRVGNQSQQWSRAVLNVSIAYNADVAHATEVIKSTADAMWSEDPYKTLMLEEPEVLGVENMGAEGIVIRLWVKTVPLEQWRIARELRTRLKAALDREGIPAPAPQRTVVIKESADGPGETA